MKLRGCAVGPLLLLASCDSRDAGPRQCVAEFYGAMRAGDVPTARALLIASERRDETMSFDPKAITNWTIRGSTTSGERAIVVVDQEGVPKPMRYVVVIEKGEWRISMNATIRESFGFDMGEFEKGIKSAGEEIGKRMRDGVEQSMREATTTKPAVPPQGR